MLKNPEPPTAQRPRLYLSERGTGDWLTIPTRCQHCNGRMYDDCHFEEWRCLVCARATHDILAVRPLPRSAYDEAAPRRGRPPNAEKAAAPKRCEGCKKFLRNWSDRWCIDCYREHKSVPPRDAWPPCTIDGCTNVRKTYSRGLCGKHVEAERSAKRRGAALSPAP